MTLYLELHRVDNGWNVHKQEHKNGSALNDTPFDSIEIAEQWANEKYENEHLWIDHKIEGYTGHLIKIADWKSQCDAGVLIDYDGDGSLIDENYKFLDLAAMPDLNDNLWFRPSDYTKKRRVIPESAKYILWYNR